MKIKLLFFSLLALACITGFSQKQVEDSIKDVIRMETETYYKRDVNAWQALFVHDPLTTRTFVSSSEYSWVKSWDSFGVATIKYLKEHPQRVPLQLSSSNYLIKTAGDMAWVEYDQVLSASPVDTLRYFSHESRVMARDKGQWKIVSLVTAYPASYGLSKTEEIENNLNAAGYDLLGEKHLDDAIEVFKMNVKLNPQSWNVYDSLAEAYALAGKRILAIKNYEMSLKLNPANESGKKALEQLKVK